MNNITSVEEACAFRGYDIQDMIPFTNPKNDHQLAVNDFAATIVVVEAINADEDGSPWIPNFDTSERKYEIWWDMRSKAAGGSGFSYYDYNRVFSYSYVGSRLVFRDGARARQFASNFTKLAAGWMVIPAK